MNLKYIILSVIVLIMLSGCVTQRNCNRKFPPQEKIERITETVTIYRDTTVYVYLKPDTIRQTDTVMVTVDRETGLTNSRRSLLETDLAWTWAQVVGGQLRHELYMNETEIQQTIANAVKEQSTTETITEVKIHEVNVLKWWQKFLMWAGVVSIFFVTLHLILSKRHLLP